MLKLPEPHSLLPRKLKDEPKEIYLNILMLPYSPTRLISSPALLADLWGCAQAADKHCNMQEYI